MKLPVSVQGKTVAIVGRAGSIIGTRQGREIDSADVVIRINWVLPTPADQIPDVGSRTDLVFAAKRAQIARRTARELGVPVFRVPGKERTRASKKHFKRPKSFRPTTGLMCILKCLAGGATEVRTYGFDLFTSGHCQERDPGGFNEGSPLGWAHNMTEERRVFRKLLRKRPEFIPDAALREALR